MSQFVLLMYSLMYSRAEVILESHDYGCLRGEARVGASPPGKSPKMFSL